MKIKSKIALVFALMTATILLMLSSFVYFLSLQRAHENFLSKLKLRVSLAAESHFDPHGHSATIVREIRERHLQLLPREKEFILHDQENLEEVLMDSIPEIPQSFAASLRNEGYAELTNGFLHFSGIQYPTPEGNHVVVMSAYDEDSEIHMSDLRNLLFLGFTTSCLLVFGLGRIFAWRIMKPITNIITRVHSINASNLHDRIPVDKQNDEVAEIGRTFNAMLDRLETTFELQSNFIGNASHELRTPLTAILGEADVILKTKRSLEEYEHSIKVMRDEAKKLEEVTSSLLRLSQISYEGKKQKIEPLMIDEMLMSIKINLGKRMPDNHVEILIQPVENNPEMYMVVCSGIWMELALTNIIQNSIKYSDNKEVLVTLSATETDMLIQISDYGIGIPEEDIEHIFEPFFRGSNTTNYSGYGIGLPLAERIIRLHGGSMKISSRPNEGTKVSIQFRRLKEN